RARGDRTPPASQGRARARARGGARVDDRARDPRAPRDDRAARRREPGAGTRAPLRPRAARRTRRGPAVVARAGFVEGAVKRVSAVTEAAFAERRQKDWNQLEALLWRTGREGLKKLAPEEIARISPLYRDVCADLSWAQAARYTAPM